MTYWRCLASTIALGATLAASLSTPLDAQVIVGVVTDSATNEVIPGVLVSLQDSTRNTLSEVRTLQDGRFLMDGQGIARFRFAVRKLGAQPSFSGYYEVPEDVDTLQVDLNMPVRGVMIATVTVVAKPPTENGNTARLEFAKMNQWRIVEPWRVAEERELSNSLEELLRRAPVAGVRLPEQTGDCFSNKRGFRTVGRKCLRFVVDDMLLNDPFLQINPMDIHFVAYVPPQQARFRWGPDAEHGVIYIAIRKYDDREEKPNPKP